MPPYGASITNKAKIMKKLILSAVIVCALSAAVTPDGSVKHENIYSQKTERCIDVVYDASCRYLGETYDSTATDEKKLNVIRRADLKDDAGDVLPEMWEYDEIHTLIWPFGYPVCDACVF